MVTPTGLGPASLYMVDNWVGESVVVVATAVVVVGGAVVAGAVLVGARVLGAAVLLEQAASRPRTSPAVTRRRGERSMLSAWHLHGGLSLRSAESMPLAVSFSCRYGQP